MHKSNSVLSHFSQELYHILGDPRHKKRAGQTCCPTLAALYFFPLEAYRLAGRPPCGRGDPECGAEGRGPCGGCPYRAAGPRFTGVERTLPPLLRAEMIIITTTTISIVLNEPPPQPIEKGNMFEMNEPKSNSS